MNEKSSTKIKNECQHCWYFEKVHLKDFGWCDIQRELMDINCESCSMFKLKLAGESNGN